MGGSGNVVVVLAAEVVSMVVAVVFMGEVSGNP